VRQKPKSLAAVTCGVVLLLTAAPAAAATKVTVRVEGRMGPLIAREQVTLGSAPVVKDGDPTHACSPTSAAGALDVSSEGDWTGAWTGAFGYRVDRVRGETGAFALFVDDKPAQAGICLTPLHRGARVLLAAVPEGGMLTPLGIRAPTSARRSHPFTVTVVAYGTTGRAKPALGATVYANGSRVGKTNRHGTIRVQGTRAGKVLFYAAKRGRVRTEVVTTRIRR
jgi:hypothetical protein